MALLAATVLQDAVIKASERMTRHENRLTDTDVLGIFYSGTNSLISQNEVANMRASASRPVKAPVLQRLDTPVRTVRRITEAATMSTSAFASLTWNPVGFEVSVEEAVNVDNYVAATEDLAHQIFHGMRKVVEYLDDLGVDVLDAAKYATPPASTLPGVTVNAGAYELDQAKFYSNLPAIMKKLNIQGPFNVISNIEGLANITEMGTYSRYNQQDLEKLLAGYNLGYSSAITPGANTIQTSYVLPVDSVGMVQWTEYDCRVGRSFDLLKYFEQDISITTPKGQTITLKFGVKYSAGPKDLSAKRSGLERAFAESWGLYVDVAFVKEYSSDTTSPIVKFNLPTPA